MRKNIGRKRKSKIYCYSFDITIIKAEFIFIRKDYSVSRNIVPLKLFICLLIYSS